MSVYQNVERYRIATETSGFGVEMALNQFIDVPVVRNQVKLTLPDPTVNPDHIQQRLDARSLGIRGVKRGTQVSFKTNLSTFSTKATTGVTAPRFWLIRFFESLCGGTFRASTGTTISGTASTARVINVADASSYRAGGAMAMVNPTTSLLEIREISTITGNQITVKMPFTFTPNVAGAQVLGCYTCYLNPNPNGALPVTLQHAIEGYNPLDRWLLLGSAVTAFTFEGETAGLPQFGWTFGAKTWKNPDGIATTMNLRGSLLGVASYSDIVQSLMADADMRLRDVGSTTLPGRLQASAVKFEPNIKYGSLDTMGDPDTIWGWARINEPPPMKVTVTYPYEDHTFDSKHEARTPQSLFFQVGTTALGGCLLSLPYLDFSGKPDFDPSGVVKSRVAQLEANIDTEADRNGATQADIDLAMSAARWHFA